MAEYIGCRNCDSTDCKGCNLKNLETMLKSGKFDCLMNGSHSINLSLDVAPVRYGKWIPELELRPELYGWIPLNSVVCSICNKSNSVEKPYCPNCGCKMNE